jgi:hypothetical protein
LCATWAASISGSEKSKSESTGNTSAWPASSHCSTLCRVAAPEPTL